MSIHTEGPHLLRQVTGTSTMKARASGGLRKLSADMNDAYPEMDVHQHLQDAARELDSGRTHSAQRHVNAAIFGLTPLQLRRHGVQDDAGHMRGKAFMQQAHRHLLLIKDIEDVHGSNRDLRQQRRNDQEQERVMRTAAPPVAVAASWDTHLHVIELVAVHESAAGRKSLQKQGKTAYGTSYPVPNVSYLHKALKAVGRVAPGKRGVLKRFLQKRAKQLGVAHHLKGTWAEGGAKNMGSEFNLAAYGIEDHFIHELAGPQRYKHGWIKLLDIGAAVPPAGGEGMPLETRKKGPGALERAAARLTDGRGPKTVGKGTPPHPTPARAAAVERIDAKKYAAAMGPNKAKAVYRALRRQGHSHSRAMAMLRSIGKGFGAGSATESITNPDIFGGKAINEFAGAAPFPGWGSVELAIELFNPAQPRVGAGAATGGQFAPPGSQPPAKGKPPAHPTANQQKKAQLLAQIKADRAKIAALRTVLSQLAKGQLSALAARNAATKAGQIGKTPAAKKSASSTPAKKGAAATSAAQAKAAKAPVKKAGPLTAKSETAVITKQIGVIARQIATATKQASALANEDGEAIELVFNINQPRDRRGRWMNAPGGMDTPNMRLAERMGLVNALGMQQRLDRQDRFAYDGRPGDMGHIRAIMAAADNMRDNSTASTALHNAGRALAGRDMKAVRVHLSVAERETRGTGNNAIVKSIRRSMQGVPKGTYERLPYGSGMAPKSLRARHRSNPGYYPSPTATWSNVNDAIELANGKTYRYRHGWIKIVQDEAAKIGKSFRDAAGTMGGGYPGAKGKLGGKFEPGPDVISARGMAEVFGSKGHVHVSAAQRQEARRAASSGPFGRHLSHREAEGFAEMFGGDKRKQKLYGKLRKGGPQHSKAAAVLKQARSRQVQMATELSAQTGRLSVTPAPRGKPGGPGLYDVKGMGHTPYLQQVVKALIEKRGMPEGKAYAIARAAIRRWSAGGGHVHPEVRAAAGKAEAGELEKQARARAKAA